MDAARVAFPGRRLVLAFQPHRYTRTRDLFEDFVKVLASADVLLLAEVYAAGEAPIASADGRALAERGARGARRGPSRSSSRTSRGMPDAIRRTARAGDVVLTMGAGSIGGVARTWATSRGSRADHGRRHQIPGAARRTHGERADGAPFELARGRAGAALLRARGPRGPVGVPRAAARDRADPVRRPGLQPAGARGRLAAARWC